MGVTSSFSVWGPWLMHELEQTRNLIMDNGVDRDICRARNSGLTCMLSEKEDGSSYRF